ncbi:MAG: DUF6017 domain-containing protein [Bacillota bacterium]|nr:DUF6017 domain-containing protein [Bacillota bacterium]
MPTSWFSKIKLDSGRPNTVAIIVLSELLYWYRPTESKDEVTGQTIWKKKFYADLLQKSIGDLADKFNFSYEQVKQALNRLQECGYIIKHKRHEVINGHKYGNHLYIELVPDRIKDLMYIESVKPVESPEPQDAEPPTKTKTTTKNKTIDYQSIVQERERLIDQIEFPILLQAYPTHTDMLCEIVDTAVDALTSSRETMKLDGEERSVEHIKHRYKKLNFCHMQYVVNSLLSHEKGIKNIPAFIRTTLYNAPATMGIHYDALIQHDKAVREGRIAM